MPRVKRSGLIRLAGLVWVGVGVALVSVASRWFATAHEQITELQPDTIIVEEGSKDIPKDIMKYLETYPWNLRVTFLNLTDNQLNMYQHEQRTMGRAEDLLQLILSESTYRRVMNNMKDKTNI